MMASGLDQGRLGPRRSPPGFPREDEAMAPIDFAHQLAFPTLDDSEVERLAGLAETCSFRDGELIFRAGQRGLPLYVVESGAIAIVDESSDESKLVVVHGPREFTGDVSLLTDRPAAISAYARGETRAYCVGQDDLRRVIQEIPDLSDKLLEAFQTRRVMLERSGFIGVRVLGHLGLCQGRDPGLRRQPVRSAPGHPRDHRPQRRAP
jgi:CRP-like cAMP-binding protein